MIPLNRVILASHLRLCDLCEEFCNRSVPVINLVGADLRAARRERPGKRYPAAVGRSSC
jgi:hypothetical protein